MIIIDRPPLPLRIMPPPEPSSSSATLLRTRAIYIEPKSPNDPNFSFTVTVNSLAVYQWENYKSVSPENTDQYTKNATKNVDLLRGWLQC